MTEQAMWRAVITQALYDRHKPSAVTHNEAQKVQDEATRWLLGCQDLEEVCDLAGIDYNYVLDMARTISRERLQEMRRNCHAKREMLKFTKKRKKIGRSGRKPRDGGASA